MPHLDNASAITAVAIFSGAFLPKKQAFIIPLAARLVTDLILGFFAWQIMLAVYCAHLAGILLGMWIKKTPLVSTQRLKILLSAAAAPLIFFLTTNFAFLYPTYPHNWNGILLAYTNGLPFLRGTIIGDVGYTLGLFGLFYFAQFLAKKHFQVPYATFPKK